MNAKQKRQLSVFLFCVLVAGFLSCTIPIKEQKLPHVVFILADDMGWGDAAEDSISILPAILDIKGDGLQRLALIADTGSHVSDRASFSIRKGAWKLLEIVPRPAAESLTIRYELYNLNSDPYETTDLSSSQPEIVQDMQRLLLECKQQGIRFLN